MNAKKILMVFGTRPEVVKLAPVLMALKRRPSLRVISCTTAQHRSLLDQMLAAFGIRPDHDLDLMEEDQSPDEVLERVLASLRPVLGREKPHLLMVQGDTTTALAAALAGFYHRIPVAHVEAGLRSSDPWNPYPEERNRVLIDHLCEVLLAPTQNAKSNLLREGLPAENIFVTGNTVVDAVQWAMRRPPETQSPLLRRLPQRHRMILVTLHRRESFGKPLRGIFRALKEIAQRHRDVLLVYPVHPNPQVRVPAHRMLRHPRILLCRPLPYLGFIQLMTRCHFLLTDSGGLQEEAPSLRKPVLVVRRVTERPEVIRAGAGKLVGTHPKVLVREVSRLLRDSRLYTKMSRSPNPFGDGKASERIASAVTHFFGLGPRPKNWHG